MTFLYFELFWFHLYIISFYLNSISQFLDTLKYFASLKEIRPAYTPLWKKKNSYRTWVRFWVKFAVKVLNLPLKGVFNKMRLTYFRQWTKNLKKKTTLKVNSERKAQYFWPKLMKLPQLSCTARFFSKNWSKLPCRVSKRRDIIWTQIRIKLTSFCSIGVFFAKICSYLFALIG